MGGGGERVRGEPHTALALVVGVCIMSVVSQEKHRCHLPTSNGMGFYVGCYKYNTEFVQLNDF